MPNADGLKTVLIVGDMSDAAMRGLHNTLKQRGFFSILWSRSQDISVFDLDRLTELELEEVKKLIAESK